MSYELIDAAANELDIGGYEVFRRAYDAYGQRVGPVHIERAYRTYFNKGAQDGLIPDCVLFFCRNVVRGYKPPSEPSMWELLFCGLL